MTVEVIGRNDSSAIKTVVCRHCACRLQYSRKDVQTVNGRDIGGGPDGHDYIICADCNKKVILRSW